MTIAQITLRITSAVEEACMLLYDGNCDLVRGKNANQASLGGNKLAPSKILQSPPVIHRIYISSADGGEICWKSFPQPGTVAGI